MVLDPATALGVAGNVFQLASVANDIISKSREYHRSATGALVEHTELAGVAEGLQELNERLQKMLSQFPLGHKYTWAEQGLQQVNSECKQIANDLTVLLETLKVSTTSQGWHSFRQAVETVWNKDRIEQMSLKLNRARDRLMIYLQVYLSSQHTSQREAISKKATIVETNILNAIDESDKRLQSKFDRLALAIEKISTADRLKFIDEWQNDNRQDLAHLACRLDALNEAETIASARQRLLDSLYYTQIQERRETIPDAHRRTFEWIFQVPMLEAKWDDFVGWLENRTRPNTLYWISGKAGSGKSCLMHFLDNNARVTDHLTVWAGKKELLVANCFFWNPGSPIQRSRHGLLRSLLHQLLAQAPELIDCINPWRWRAFCLGATRVDDWTDHELLSAFQKLVEQASSTKRICIFIDGFDEFGGTDQQRNDMMQLFLSMPQGRDVKVCLSSRPWPIFETAFEKCPKLRLHELTRNDIQTYVTDTLQGNKYFRELQSYAGLGAESSRLISEIVEGAAGVFLWVYLVVRELLQGLTAGYGLRHLLEKLYQIPKDLKDYFMLMMKSISPSDYPKASALFQIILAARQPPSLMTLSFIEEDDVDFSLNMHSGGTTLGALQYRNDTMARRLNSLCMGLLEVSLPSPSIPYVYDDSDALFHLNVDYLHRTVRDFLLSEEAQEILHQHELRPFNTDSFLCNAFLSQMAFLENLALAAPKLSSTTSESHGRARQQTFLECADNFMFYALELEKTTGIPPLALFEKAESLNFAARAGLPYIYPKPHSIQNTIIYESLATWHKNGNSLLTTAIQYNLTHYTCQKLDAKLIKAKNGRPFLDYALRRRLKVPTSLNLPPNEELVTALLAFGADPNQIFIDRTVWSHFFHLMKEVGSQVTRSEPIWAQITAHLIKHGAAAKLLDLRTARKILVANEFSILFEEAQAQRLRKLLEQHQSRRSFKLVLRRLWK